MSQSFVFLPTTILIKHKFVNVNFDWLGNAWIDPLMLQMSTMECHQRHIHLFAASKLFALQNLLTQSLFCEVICYSNNRIFFEIWYLASSHRIKLHIELLMWLQVQVKIHELCRATHDALKENIPVVRIHFFLINSNVNASSVCVRRGPIFICHICFEIFVAVLWLDEQIRSTL